MEPGSVMALRTLIRLDDHDIPRNPHENTVPPTRMDSDIQKHSLSDTNVPLDNLGLDTM